MTIGHPTELFVLAFDHRGSFAREVLGVEHELTGEEVERVRGAKRLVFDGVLEAVHAGRVEGDRAGVLVDEQFGGEIPRLAHEHGVAVALAVERSSQALFEFEYGDRFREHIDRFQPTFAKVLVRYNPDGDSRGNRAQLERLRTLSDFLRDRECKLMYELLVPPLDAQMAGPDGREVYERALRPALIVRGIAAAHEAGIEPDVWKVEGVETPADAEAVAAAARDGVERRDVRCIVLGAGADDERVARWLDIAAATDGYSGFAIGRSIWRAPIRDFLDGRSDRARAVSEVAMRFGDLVARWRVAGENREPQGSDEGPETTRR